MAQPPGSDFGADFFKYVLGPTSDAITGFAQVALPTPSGLSGIMGGGGLQLGIPGLTTPGPGAFNPVATEGGYAKPLATSETVDPFMASLWAPQKAAAAKQAAAAAPRSNDPAYAGSYAPNVQKFAGVINQVANETGVPARVLASIVHIECPNCDPNTVRSDSRAAGIAQVVGASTDPYQNLTAAANLLREKQHVFGIDPNDWPSTAAAYFGAWQPGVGVTNAADSTGMTGYKYVDLFKNAWNVYPDNLAQPAPKPLATASVANARPTQFDRWLTHDEQLAACGPAVIAGLSGMSVREATDMAARNGWWSVDTGMHGGGAEAMALKAAGVPNTYVPTVNVQQAAESVQAGKPVVFSMGYVSPQRPGHYFLADNFNPRTGEFHVGQSGKDISGGDEWMTLAQMSRLGPPESMIFIEK